LSLNPAQISHFKYYLYLIMYIRFIIYNPVTKKKKKDEREKIVYAENEIYMISLLLCPMKFCKRLLIVYIALKES